MAAVSTWPNAAVPVIATVPAMAGMVADGVVLVCVLRPPPAIARTGKLVGNRGLGAAAQAICLLMAALVKGPSTPIGLMACALWKRVTAALVFGPK